jgi:dihydroneopterin aldolase
MNAVHLKDLKFHAHHGLYPGEEKTGGPFEVHVSVYYNADGPVTALHQTINYVTLFDIVKQQMAVRSNLIETVAENICSNIYAAFPVIEEIEVTIFKCSPPVPGFEGKTGITLKKNY